MGLKWKGGSLQSKRTHPAADGDFLAGDKRQRGIRLMHAEDTGIWGNMVPWKHERFITEKWGNRYSNEQSLSRDVGTSDISWVPHIPKAVPFPWGCPCRAPAFVLGMGVPTCFPGVLLLSRTMGWWWVFCAGSSGVLCAEEDEGVPAAVNCVCSTGSCDHSSRIYLAGVGSCFLLMQNNKNIIITKVQAQWQPEIMRENSWLPNKVLFWIA